MEDAAAALARAGAVPDCSTVLLWGLVGWRTASGALTGNLTAEKRCQRPNWRWAGPINRTTNDCAGSSCTTQFWMAITGGNKMNNCL